MNDRTPLSLSLQGVCDPDLSFVSLFLSPTFFSSSNVLTLPICSISISLHLYVTRDFSIRRPSLRSSSQPLKLPCLASISLAALFHLSFPSLSVRFSLSLLVPTGCSWFNLRLDLTSGPHTVSSPFSARWPLLVCLSFQGYLIKRFDSLSIFS